MHLSRGVLVAVAASASGAAAWEWPWQPQTTESFNILPTGAGVKQDEFAEALVDAGNIPGDVSYTTTAAYVGSNNDGVPNEGYNIGSSQTLHEFSSSIHPYSSHVSIPSSKPSAPPSVASWVNGAPDSVTSSTCGSIINGNTDYPIPDDVSGWLNGLDPFWHPWPIGSLVPPGSETASQSLTSHITNLPSHSSIFSDKAALKTGSSANLVPSIGKAHTDGHSNPIQEPSIPLLGHTSTGYASTPKMHPTPAPLYSLPSSGPAANPTSSLIFAIESALSASHVPFQSGLVDFGVRRYLIQETGGVVPTPSTPAESIVASILGRYTHNTEPTSVPAQGMIISRASSLVSQG